MIVDYVIKCSKMNYGMSYKEIHQLAYDYGRRLQGKFPSSLTDNKIAGIDWLQGFLKGQKNLMLRKPEFTSVFRATAFNKTNVMEFFWVIPRRLIYICRRFGTLSFPSSKAFEDGTDRVFRNVGIYKSDAGESPKRKQTTF